MKLDRGIEHAAEAERELAGELLRAGERHKADHDVYHLSRTLAKLSNGHLEQLAPFAERYGASIDADPVEGGGLTRGLREKGAELAGRRPEPGVLLLDDLERLYLLAAGASIAWTALAQGAQAARDRDLLSVVSDCHAENLRVIRWLTTKVKEAAPQALTA